MILYAVLIVSNRYVKLLSRCHHTHTCEEMEISKVKSRTRGHAGVRSGPGTLGDAVHWPSVLGSRSVVTEWNGS